MRRVFRQILINAAIIAGVFGFDRWTKIFASSQLDHTVSIVPHLLGLTSHHNFGLLADTPAPRWIVVAVTGAIIGVLTWKVVKDTMRRASTSFVISLVIGGALGNLYDRAVMGFVFDWILLFDRSVINIADITIAAGIGLYLWIASRPRPTHTDD